LRGDNGENDLATLRDNAFDLLPGVVARIDCEGGVESTYAKAVVANMANGAVSSNIEILGVPVHQTLNRSMLAAAEYRGPHLACDL